jgi:hypothetical protein|tara:strand:+ start:1466 stop:1738 length:273 start_codon:yes stop_codon:yes gene_type:complete
MSEKGKRHESIPNGELGRSGAIPEAFFQVAEVSLSYAADRLRREQMVIAGYLEKYRGRPLTEDEHKRLRPLLERKMLLDAEIQKLKVREE